MESPVELVPVQLVPVELLPVELVAVQLVPLELVSVELLRVELASVSDHQRRITTCQSRLDHQTSVLMYRRAAAP